MLLTLQSGLKSLVPKTDWAPGMPSRFTRKSPIQAFQLAALAAHIKTRVGSPAACLPLPLLAYLTLGNPKAKSGIAVAWQAGEALR